MKKALSLIEVLISIIIITIVIGSLIKIEQNNLFIIEKSDVNKLNQAYISLYSLNYQVSDNRNKNLIIDENLTLNNEELKKQTKATNITIKNKTLDTKELEHPPISFTTIESTYSIKNSIKKKFYTIKINK
ncbi:hypothetical protein CRV02_12760 [Arcobacter sp. CECT 8989]|uniref:hypothetical protein n=1 Tax=Arcobacter sp. CECT 8989 TaxID=2044509 RepID=UPI00100BF2DE|nr:hypothetical protein [Arcobacter sp. CECT 8989]RXJ98916.1 hypothetical protein CRV02_12760 [Arcobacter sp. CECT 8989]